MSERTEILGLNYVRRIVEDELGWIWRPIDYRDHGIDGYIELGEEALNHYRAFGSLIAVQIKSGVSYVGKSQSHFSITFKETRWFDYWLDYPIPVIVVIFDPELGIAYWENAANSCLSQTGKTFSLCINMRSLFDRNSRARLVLTAFNSRISSGTLEVSGAISDLLSTTVPNAIEHPVDDDVRRILFGMQNTALLEKKSLYEKSISAIDTSLEDFDPRAWTSDLEYRRSLKVLLRVTDFHKVHANIRQIYSLRASSLSKQTVDILCPLAQLHLSHGINVGFLRREMIPRDLDRDFCIVNEQFVIDCTVKNWAQSAPLFGRSAVRFFMEVFRDLSERALWVGELRSDLQIDAIKAYYEYDELPDHAITGQ